MFLLLLNLYKNTFFNKKNLISWGRIKKKINKFRILALRSIRSKNRKKTIHKHTLNQYFFNLSQNLFIGRIFKNS